MVGGRGVGVREGGRAGDGDSFRRVRTQGVDLASHYVH